MKHLLAALLLLAGPAAAGGFSNWAAVVVAGDSYSEDQKDSKVFDNGRQAIVERLQKMGFRPANIRQFTDWPEQFPGLSRSIPKRIAKEMKEAAAAAPEGCLVYVTSHGSELGAGIGDYVLGPRTLKHMLAKACPKRPAVVVVSACYSGVFVPYLKAPDRFVLTAAAKDRSSFGCGASDRFTFFDACAIESLSKAHDFPGFAQRTLACVTAREKKEDVDLPSNPQVAIGSKSAAMLPHW
jgi:hypothetical protein